MQHRLPVSILFAAALAGWLPAARAAGTPAGTLDPRYVFPCEPAADRNAVRPVPRAERVPAGGAAASRLILTLRDADSQLPLAARVGVFRAGGGVVAPPDEAAAVFQDIGAQSYFYAEDACTLLVPDGNYVVRAGRGFEYEPVAIPVTVAGDAAVRVDMHRFADMGAAGWFSGDTHAHIAHAPLAYALGADDAARVMRAEDVNVLNVLEEQPFFTGAIDPRSDATHILYFSKEQRNAHFSHLTVVGLREWIPDLGCDAGTVLCGRTLDRIIYDLVHAGGEHVAVIATHPFPTTNVGNLTGWPGVGVWRGMSIDLAASAVDAMDILCYTHQAPPAGVADYFHALNAGFRLPPSAGSDASLATGQSYPPAGYRVYVAPPAGFTFDTWIDGLRAGRSFVTNYPLIREFQAGGAAAGDTLRHNGQRVKGWVDVVCAVPFDKVEIIAGSQVVKTLLPASGTSARSLRASFDFDPRGVGWVVARVTGSTGEWHVIGANGLFAQTAPVYLQARADDTGGGGHVTVIDVVRPAITRFMDFLGQVDALYTTGGSFPGGGEPAYRAAVNATRAYFENLRPDPPGPFALVSPMDLSWTYQMPWSNTPTPVFRWRQARDPDPGDSITYSLTVDDDPLFKSAFRATGLADTFLALPPENALADQVIYYWQVRAVDSTGLGTNSALSLFIVDYTSTGVRDPAPVSASLSVWPNPFNPALRVRLGIPAGWTRTRVDVFDASGAFVRRLMETDEAGAWIDAEWDGRDASGNAAGSGVYFVRATSAGGHAVARKAVLLK